MIHSLAINYWLYRNRIVIAYLLTVTIAATSIHAAALTTLFSFNKTNGAYPGASLTFDSSGNLYGTTEQGGSINYGTIFRRSANGTFTTLASFNGNNGDGPSAKLVPDGAGNFYGTTIMGGANVSGSTSTGTVFRVTPDGTITTIASMPATNWALPRASVTVDASGNLYGTSYQGGAYGYGSMFKITPSGTFTTVRSFNGSSDGGFIISGLVPDGNGNFYGTTSSGGSSYYGSVFKITPNGILTRLVTFNGTNGSNPYADITLDSSGNLYGTTGTGGASDHGTIFKYSAKGVFTSLFSFNGTNGWTPHSELLIDAAGNLFGTTAEGGSTANGGYGWGTVFKLSPNGSLTTLAIFNKTNGGHPYSGLIADSFGNLYGTTNVGGSKNYGTIYKVTDAGFIVPEPSSAMFYMVFGIAVVLKPTRRYRQPG